jgi:hypothetical protein
VAGGTRVTEYTAPGSGFGQRALVGVLGRVMAGTFARAREALRSAVEAGRLDEPSPPG